MNDPRAGGRLSRALSRIWIRLLAFNVLLVFLPAAGLLYLDTYERQLLAEAYPEDTFVSDRTIDSHVKRLRRKFEAVDPAFDLVETVYGLGYRWRERVGREP